MITDPMSIWVRLGDADNYHACNDLADLSDALLGIQQNWAGIRWRHGGLEACGFKGCNYVSLYWGDRDAAFQADLDASEHFVLEELLKGAQNSSSGSVFSGKGGC